MKKRLLLDLARSELAQPGYRARQVWEWVWCHVLLDFAGMTNIPEALRKELSARFGLDPFTVLARQSDEDRTEKVLLGLGDGTSVEAVLIREEDRRTVCISTQVGCPVGCVFCATGQMGFVRNLSPGEIAAQVLYFARAFRETGERVTHVVVMGRGEPLLNYSATLKALGNLNDPGGFNLGARRITISTVGVVPEIIRLAQEGRQFNLAVSIHAPDDALRKKLVPWAERWPLSQVLSAAEAYSLATGLDVTVRRSRGVTIQAGCGQLRSQFLETRQAFRP